MPATPRIAPRHSSPRRVSAAALALLLAAGLAAFVQLAATPSAGAAASGIAVERLTTNGRTNPLGIPGREPSFGWASTASARAVVQSAYQVRVASSEAALESADVWDSGKVSSDRQVDVAYGGPALTSQTRYVWQVRVWDGAGEASAWSEPNWFETGMLTASDWGDADWIGAPAGNEVNKWTDYTAEFDFSIQEHAFAAFVRAADLRNGYMWQVSVADGTARFRPHVRVNGAYQLLGNIDISSTVTAEQLATGRHTMTVKVEGSTVTTSLNGKQIDTRQHTAHSKGFVGFRSDHANGTFERFTAHRVEVVAKSGETLLDTDFTAGSPFTGGQLTKGNLHFDRPTDALYASTDDHLPLLRTGFETEAGKTVASARVYASARGLYELNLNGEKVGDQHLAPGWTDYQDRIQHQTYDVTDQVTEGVNAFGAELANGWWAGKVGMWGPGVYGKKVSLIARLRIDYTDGSSQWVDTDEGWTSHHGPYAFTDNIDGETYDAQHAQAGWDQPAFDDSNWNPVEVASSATSLLVPQGDEPIRTTQELAVDERTEPTPGAFVYDLGQNMVGVARMVLQGNAGDTVRIRYGEELNKDGTLYTANLRAAKVTDYYKFAADGTVTYEPKFTQHGFRYVEITGAATPPSAADVTGVVWESDLPDTGTLETSSAMLNQLASNISWGQRGNFLSIPTDTPARDERLGWSGDINVFAPTASYLKDTRAFLAKWMQDMSDTQFANGDLPGIAPEPPGVGCCGSGTGWSDAGITVPYALWDSYGDASIARQFYPEMTRFMDYVRGHAGADLIDPGRGGWGDWLNLDDPTPTAVMGTAYLAEDARMMSEMAAALGKDADAAEYAQLSEDVRAAFAEAFISDNGTVSGNSQTAYAMALGMDLVPDALRPAVAAKFVAKLASANNHLTTGFLGTPWLLPALSSIGRDDLAYTMLMHEDYPSWGYEVRMGATTMWERWNSIMPDGTFGDVTMNSFNHYAYGAVGDWMYENIGGIAAAEPGYKKSRIAPKVGGGLTEGSGELRSVYGTIATDWTATGDDITLTVDVPVNTTADVVLPGENAWAVTEGGQFLADAEGVHDVVVDDGTVTATVGSGHYEFEVTAGNALLGSILDDIEALRTHVDGLEDDGDLETGDADHVDGDLVTTSGHVAAALSAVLDGEATTTTTELQSALTVLQDLRGWLGESGVDRPVHGDLDRRLGAIEAKVVRALASSMGISVALPPVSSEVLPGSTVSGTLEVSSTGDAEVTDLAARVSVDGWEDGSATAENVAAGESVQLPVSLTVPARQAPGSYDATWELTFTTGEETYTLTGATVDWAKVTSGVEIGDVTVEPGTADPSERAVVAVEVTNTGDAEVRGHAVLDLPAGWRSVPSDQAVVPAGETVTVDVPVTLPLDRIGGPTEVTVRFRRSGATLASATASPPFPVVVPPTAAAVDHVDFGNGPSEGAHALLTSPTSGTNTEAGYTRRYSHSQHPGSWYSVELDVPAGEPFILRGIETFDRAVTKKYNVYVDDVLVKTQVLPRAENGAGIKVYDALIDHPSLAGNDGRVRVKFEFPSDAAGFGDPSLADVWVLRVPADTQAPDVSAHVSAGVVGDNGWMRSDAQVSVDAVDNRDAGPRVEVGVSSGWQDYVAPVTVAGEGKHTLSFRATDDAGNSSGARTLPVWIDTTAPTTQLSVTREPGVEASDRATLGFTAEDALSGVARTTYRVDGGAWQVVGDEPIVVEGYGEHLVDYATTDVAGNVEVMRQAVVTLADVDEVAALLPPQVTGSARFGSTLSSTVGTWNTKGLTFTRQWLRNGTPVDGATGETYRLSRADLGKRISVQVTASKDGRTPGVATSTATARVTKASSKARVQVDRTSVPRGKAVRATAVVTASATTPSGKVAFLVDGKVVKKVALRNGKAALNLRMRTGKHKVTVRYLGSSGVSPSKSSAVTVRVR